MTRWHEYLSRPLSDATSRRLARKYDKAEVHSVPEVAHLPLISQLLGAVSGKTMFATPSKTVDTARITSSGESRCVRIPNGNLISDHPDIKSSER